MARVSLPFEPGPHERIAVKIVDDRGIEIPQAPGCEMMRKTKPDRLIITSPYEEPRQHWSYDRETRSFTLEDGRRPAGYIIASEASRVL